MTIRSSYVFYKTRNPRGERTEGTLLNRVFITDTKITLYAKEIVKTAKSGVLFEKIRAQQTISLHTNSHGDKYIKRFNKSPGGSFTDTSLDLIMGNPVRLVPLLESTFNDDCCALIERTILGWFDMEYADKVLQSCQDKLLFPALRDKTFPRSTQFHGVLATLQMNTSCVTKALRANSSWNSFIHDLCNNTVKTEQDIKIVQQYPTTLLPLAVIDIGHDLYSLYEASGNDWETVLKFSSTFSVPDMRYLHFMFKNLSQSQKVEAWRTVFTLVSVHNEKNKMVFRGLRKELPFVDQLSLQGVPFVKRSEIAQLLHSSLIKLSDKLQTTIYGQVRSQYLITEMDYVFRHWFASTVLPPQMQSKVTVADIMDRYHQLFGVPFKEDSAAIRFFVYNEITYCLIRDRFINGPSSAFSTDIFVSLDHLVVKNRPREKGISGMNGFINNDNQVMRFDRALYSLDDIMELIEKGVEETDRNLTKLGRPITPENRVAFLTLGSSERQFKNTWKFYDWGVTDSSKILALKSAKVTKKDDIETYNALPDEMFFELLALEAGKEFTMMSY